MKICGILIAKAVSKRFPDKNKLLYKQNAELLIQYCDRENVYMFTDSRQISKECYHKEITVIRKSKNFDDEFTYLDALRYAYYSLNTKYDIIISIICNSVNHNLFSIENAVKKIQSNKDIVEVRGFNTHGDQSGLFIFKADKLPEKWHHMGSVFDAGREIHFKEEL